MSRRINSRMNPVGTGNYRDEWITPPWVIHAAGEVDLDPCASPKTRHGKINYTKDDDGLVQDWSGMFWFCNPPFSDKLPWIQKCAENPHGILLLPRPCSTKWSMELLSVCDGFFLPEKRIIFKGKGRAMFDCALYAFGAEAASRIMSTGVSGSYIPGPFKVERFV